MRRHWQVLLAVAFTIAGGTALYVSRLPDEYETVAVVAIVPRQAVAFPGADYVKLDAARYIAFATAPRTLQRLGGNVGSTALARDAGLQESIDVALATDTSNITITVRLASAADTARIANLVGQAMVDYSRSDPVLQANFVTRAVVPTRPTAPLRHLDIAAGAAAGLIAGVVMAVVMEARYPRIRHWREVGDIGDLPLLGLIPKSRRRDRSLSGSPHVTAVAQAVCSNLLRGSPGDQRVLAVTSSARGEGTTTIARAIASETTARGHSALLLEGDPMAGDRKRGWERVPSVGWKRSETVEHSLTGVHHGTTLDTSLVVSKRTSISDSRLAEVLGEQKQRFDFVIIDAPPPFDGDGLALIAQSDQVLMVLSAGTRADHVGQTLDLLAALKAHVLGIVGNRMG